MPRDDILGDDTVAPFKTQVREVVEISEIIDEFDLVSADRETCLRFKALRRLYVDQAIALIELIEERAADLRIQLQAMLLDS